MCKDIQALIHEGVRFGPVAALTAIRMWFEMERRLLRRERVSDGGNFLQGASGVGAMVPFSAAFFSRAV